MRIKRSLQLWPKNGNVHLYWRCHNREPYLDSPEFKDLYFTCLEQALKYKDQFKTCQIHAFCSMRNHFHQSVSYSDGSQNLSKFMRYAHSLFGARYNKTKARSGKVAEGRPKTPRTQNESHEMRMHFYIEANPIRAGFRKLENLQDYLYSSYGFYAFGKRTKYTHLLTIPSWYMKLGKTSLERRRRYRKLFREYLKINTPDTVAIFMQRLIGDPLWIEEALEQLKNMVQNKNVEFINVSQRINALTDTT